MSWDLKEGVPLMSKFGQPAAWLLCPLRLNTIKYIILNKETTTFSLQDMFRHSYVIFSCKCDFNGCTFEFIWNYVTNYKLLNI